MHAGRAGCYALAQLDSSVSLRSRYHGMARISEMKRLVREWDAKALPSCRHGFGLALDWLWADWLDWTWTQFGHTNFRSSTALCTALGVGDKGRALMRTDRDDSPRRRAPAPSGSGCPGPEPGVAGVSYLRAGLCLCPSFTPSRVRRCLHTRDTGDRRGPLLCRGRLPDLSCFACLVRRFRPSARVATVLHEGLRRGRPVVALGICLDGYRQRNNIRSRRDTKTTTMIGAAGRA